MKHSKMNKFKNAFHIQIPIGTGNGKSIHCQIYTVEKGKDIHFLLEKQLPLKKLSAEKL